MRKIKNNHPFKVSSLRDILRATESVKNSVRIRQKKFSNLKGVKLNLIPKNLKPKNRNSPSVQKIDLSEQRFLSKKNVDKMCRDSTLARTKRKINGRNFDSLHLHFRFRSAGS